MMKNLSYVRFENTLRDLQDCNDHIWDDDLSEDEDEARKHLIALCKRIASESEEVVPVDENGNETDDNHAAAYQAV